MRRRGWIVAAVVTLAAGALAVGVAGLGGGEPELPTATVERLDLVRWVPAEGVLRAARTTPLVVPREGSGRLRIAWLAPAGSRLAAGDLVVRFDGSELEDELANSEADLAAADERRAKLETRSRSDLANLERDAETARRELEHADRFAAEDEEIFSRVEIIESTLDRELAAERLEHAEEARRRSRRSSRTEREILEIERRRVETELSRARRGLAALEVRAPHAGILVYKRDWRGEPPRVGETVFPGQPLAEIPSLDEMEVEAFVLEADAGGLAAGKPARVRLEAHPGRLYDARIERVDTLAKPRVRASPVQYFAVTLELDRTEPEVMKPGQRVRAELRLAEARGALVVPRQAVFRRDGESVVWVERGGRFVPVAVELGPAGAGRISVEGPLEPGERVALADPARPAAAEDDAETPAAGAPALPGSPR